MKSFLASLLLMATLGCVRGPSIDHSYRAKSQDSRAQFLILHFTGGTWEASLKTLTEDNVSSHYLVRDNPVRIYQLVSEDRRAYQAGDSSWKGQTQLNAASIGIEIQNLGDTKGPDMYPGGTAYSLRSLRPPGPPTSWSGDPPMRSNGIVYHDYPKAQIDAVIGLVKAIVARHEIRADRILGHSDIAPQRKVDPGPTFPWKRFADEGIIPWPDGSAVAAKRRDYEAALPDVAWFQAKLAVHGFATPQTGSLDEATKNILSVFQMKYRPARYDGLPDAETAAILDVLTSPTAKAP